MYREVLVEKDTDELSSVISTAWDNLLPPHVASVAFKLSLATAICAFIVVYLEQRG